MYYMYIVIVYTVYYNYKYYIIHCSNYYNSFSVSTNHLITSTYTKTEQLAPVV